MFQKFPLTAICAAAVLTSLCAGASAQMATAPTALAQYELELINRARANPSAEAARYGIDLNAGLEPGTISTQDKQPLAFNPALLQAAVDYNRLIAANSARGHVFGGTTVTERAAAAGYTGVATAENVAREWNSVPVRLDTAFADGAHANLFVDELSTTKGHRLVILGENFREAGISFEQTSNFTSAGPSFPFAAYLTVDFGIQNASTFLTGVVFNDIVRFDNFYTPGEGLGDVTIKVFDTQTGALRGSTTSYASGGYSLAIAPGMYDVQFVNSAGAIYTASTNWTAQANFKLDAVNPSFTAPVPEPATWLSLGAGLLLLAARRHRRQGVQRTDG